LATKTDTKKRLIKIESAAKKVFFDFDWTKCGGSNVSATKDYIAIQKILERYYNKCK
tara:strand:- start:1005 stop:1175 length:171 start_codon:yes stop_codon:yes gene_type:complete